MGDIFFKLLNNSITAGWLILVVLGIRFLFRKMPKWISCLLWGVVAIIENFGRTCYGNAIGCD